MSKGKIYLLYAEFLHHTPTAFNSRRNLFLDKLHVAEEDSLKHLTAISQISATTKFYDGMVKKKFWSG